MRRYMLIETPLSFSGSAADRMSGKVSNSPVACDSQDRWPKARCSPKGGGIPFGVTAHCRCSTVVIKMTAPSFNDGPVGRKTRKMSTHDVPGECNARLFLADDYGDNVCTLRCQL